MIAAGIIFKPFFFQSIQSVPADRVIQTKLSVTSRVTVPVFIGHDDKKHELAVLFSNRAECHLKLNNTEEAFTDAKESVAYDGHWYRGHVRVGRALVKKKKASNAVKAFANAYNALGAESTDVQKKDVLKELVKTVTVHMSK